MSPPGDLWQITIVVAVDIGAGRYGRGLVVAVDSASARRRKRRSDGGHDGLKRNVWVHRWRSPFIKTRDGGVVMFETEGSDASPNAGRWSSALGTGGCGQWQLVGRQDWGFSDCVRRTPQQSGADLRSLG